MVPRINKPNLFQLASRRWSQRTPAAQTRCPAPFHSGALAPAVILGLLTLPAAAASLDPTKVNADATAQRTLEAIDAAHHLQSLGTLAHYVLAADAQGQTCTLEDKGNDIFMMECALGPQHPKYSLLLTGENGRLLAVSMYGADSHLLPTDDAFNRLTAIAPVQTETPAPTPAVASVPQGIALSAATTNKTLFFALNRNSRRVNLGTAASLDRFIKQIGGKCSFADTPGTGAAIVCLFPDANAPKDVSANELELDTAFDPTACPNFYECYEVRDIKLNDKRLTQEQYIQIFVDHK